MHQFFVDDSQIGKEYVTITGADVNHIRNVLRMKIGEKIRISSGNKDFFCSIAEVGSDFVQADILDEEAAPLCYAWFYTLSPYSSPFFLETSLCLGSILLIVSVDGCLYLIVDDYLAIYFFIIEVLHHICHGNDGGSGETV